MKIDLFFSPKIGRLENGSQNGIGVSGVKNTHEPMTTKEKVAWGCLGAALLTGVAVLIAALTIASPLTAAVVTGVLSVITISFVITEIALFASARRDNKNAESSAIDNENRFPQTGSAPETNHNQDTQKQNNA